MTAQTIPAEKSAAFEIIEGMNDADEAGYTYDGWYQSVSDMLVDDWEGLDLEAVLGYIESILLCA